MICGRKPKLRPDQIGELFACYFEWLAWRASRPMSLKQKALEFGIAHSTAQGYINDELKQPIR